MTSKLTSPEPASPTEVLFRTSARLKKRHLPEPSVPPDADPGLRAADCRAARATRFSSKWLLQILCSKLVQNHRREDPPASCRRYVSTPLQGPKKSLTHFALSSRPCGALHDFWWVWRLPTRRLCSPVLHTTATLMTGPASAERRTSLI